MSSEDPFAYFGLERASATASDVKRAYAVRLKSTRPEDDPQGFMKLRAMLESGLNQVRWRDLYGNDEDDDEDYDLDEAPDPQPNETIVIDSAVIEDDDASSSNDRPRASEHRLDHHPALVDRTHPIFHRPQANDEDDPDAWEGDDDVDELEYNPEAINTVMDDIIDLLTGPWGGAARKTLQQKLDAPEISGIDEYQELSSRVREFLCDRSGFYLDEMKAPLRPPWLTQDVLDAFESHFGWSRQASTLTWEQKQNSWMARLALSLAPASLPDAAPASGPLRLNPADPQKSRNRMIDWIIRLMFAAVVIRILILFFQ